MNLGKKVFVLIFLLIVLIGVFAIQGDDFGKGYFSWLKNKLVGMGPELNLTERDSGLDFTEIDINNFSNGKPADAEGSGVATELPTVEDIMEEEDGLENIETIIEEPEEIEGIGGPIPGSEEVMSLEEIEQELERIIKEIEILIVEVQKLANSNL